MPAFPFQPFPTLEQYCEWLVGEGGTFEHGANEWGTFTRLVSSDGERSVIEAGTELTEGLAPSSLMRLDARLDLLSPWWPRFDDGTPADWSA